VEVIDAQKNNWIAKFGSEVNAEVFATRIAWAVGYFVDATYFVPSGKIVGAKKLERARNAIETDGTFANACFELREKNATFLKKSGWTWQNNPFVGTRELNGLKIVMMLTSNWDNKDARNDSSNLGILQYPETGVWNGAILSLIGAARWVSGEESSLGKSGTVMALQSKLRTSSRA